MIFTIDRDELNDKLRINNCDEEFRTAKYDELTVLYSIKNLLTKSHINIKEI